MPEKTHRAALRGTASGDFKVSTDPGAIGIAESEALRRAAITMEGVSAGFDEQLSAAVLHALGPRPDGLGPHSDGAQWNEVLARICFPSRWLEDLPGLIHFYRALHQFVRKDGGTKAGAELARRELQTGSLRAVLVMEDGSHADIAPHRWRKSKQLWWSGWEMALSGSSGMSSRGDVYIVVSAPEAASPTHANESERYIPAFMKLMFEALRHFEMPGRQPKKEELVQWFLGRQVDGVTVTNNQAKGLATFIRPPAAMKGGQKRISSP